jgi:hypothetical protein
MSLFTLLLPTVDTPNYSYNTDLDGTEYKLTFKYSVRESGWYLSFHTLSGVLLISNIRLVPWLSLVFPFNRPNLPLGDLVLTPKSYDYPHSPEITLENLSTDFTLTYLAVNE